MTDTVLYIRQSLEGLYPAGEITCLVRLLMERIGGIAPYQLLAGKGKELSETEKERIREIVAALQKSVPVQYALGTACFYGREFIVNPSVLIPRPETEELVEIILKDIRQKKHATPLRIADVGTGSGCIALTLAAEVKEAQVTAVDISAEALATARANAARLKVNATFIQADILSDTAGDTIPGGFDLIVSNPPYVMASEKKEMEKNVLDYEPHLALFVDDGDPLLFYRHIARFGKKRLHPGGRLYFEINARCGEATTRLLQTEGYRDITLIRDMCGKDRMIKASI